MFSCHIKRIKFFPNVLKPYLQHNHYCTSNPLLCICMIGTNSHFCQYMAKYTAFVWILISCQADEQALVLFAHIRAAGSGFYNGQICFIQAQSSARRELYSGSHLRSFCENVTFFQNVVANEIHCEHFEFELITVTVFLQRVDSPELQKTNTFSHLPYAYRHFKVRFLLPKYNGGLWYLKNKN